MAVEEIGEEAETGGLAFFGVELGGEETAALDGAGEGGAVVGVGGDESRVGGGREVGVDEVEVGIGAEAGPDRVAGVDGDGGVPAHVGDFQC